MLSDLTSLLALIFGSATLLVIGVSRAAAGKSSDLSSRLQGIHAQDSRPDQVDKGGQAPLLRVLTTVSQTAGKSSLFNRLARVVDKNLTGADIPLKSEEYIVLTAGLSLLAGILTALALASVYHGAAAVALGALLSTFWVKLSKARRLNKFNSLIGDSLVIMSNALRSGFSFLQAMDMVRKEMPDPIAKEFSRTFQEMNLGTPTEEALENLNKRVGSEDLELVITAVLIQRQVGGNLAEILDNIAGTIRERVRIQGEIKTLTAQGRISGIIIGVLPLLLAAALSAISPQYLKPLATDPLGRGMLATALALELLGILIIRKIINIKV
ncbi:MAG: type II secretion system F family protein [Peptococcaceae bacterium]|nr:type II secretion system F family protein [Peptococcaceae bacterium]